MRWEKKKLSLSVSPTVGLTLSRRAHQSDRSKHDEAKKTKKTREKEVKTRKKDEREEEEEVFPRDSARFLISSHAKKKNTREREHA